MRFSPIVAALLCFVLLPFAHAGLVGLYTFDDPANTHADDSGNGNTLADPGPAGEIATWGAATGYNGSGGFTFDGNDRLLAPIDINTGPMPQMSWGAWVRTDSLTPGLRKVMGHDNGAWDRTIGLDTRDQSFRYTSFTGFQRPVEGTPGPVNTTDWTFLAATYDQGAQVVTVYVDLDASTSADPLVVVSETGNFNAGWPTFSIGSLRPDNANEAWVGAIDNAFIFDELLDEARLSEIRRRGVPEILGIAEGDPALKATPISLFGDLTGLGAGPGPISRSVTVSNEGATQDLDINGVAVNGADAGLYEIQFPIDTVLGPGEETDIEIVFTPPVEGGSFAATLDLISNDAVRPLVEVPLDATVTSDPNVELVFADPLFGTIVVNEIPSVVTRTVAIRNTGVANTLTLTPLPVVTGPDAARYGLAGPISVPPGEERDLEVRLDPQGGTGPFVAGFTLSTDDPDAAPVDINLDAEIVVVPPATLLAFYCFDNEADPFEDLSGNGNHLTSVGVDPTYEPGGGFDGSGGLLYENTVGNQQGDQRLISPIDVNPAALPTVSMGAFVRTDTLNPDLYKFMGHDDGAWDRTIGLDNRGGAFRYTAFTGTNNNEPVDGTPSPVNTTDWTFVGVTYNDPAGTVNVYVDLDASTTADPLVVVSEPTVMGPGQNTLSIGSLRPDNNNEGWVGSMDNVFIYEGILTGEEMTAIRDQGKRFIVGGGGDLLNLAVLESGGNLVFTWDSLDGNLYNLRSTTDPEAEPDPSAWAIFDGNTDIAATPPQNTLAIPMPTEPLRLFVVEQFPAPPAKVFADDFESGQGGWTTGSDIDPGTDWELGTPANVGPPAANSPVNCFGTNIGANYADSETSIWLRSPPIDLTTAGGATLNFHHFADIESMFDAGVVNVLDASDDSLIAEIESFDGLIDPWEQVTRSIPAAALGRSVKIEFRFTSDDFNGVPQAGWYIDDVCVTVP